MHISTDSAALLQFYVDIGADEFIGDEPINRLTAPEVKQPLTNVSPLKPVPQQLTPAGGTIEALKDAKDLAAKANSLEELKSALDNFDGISLKRTASQMIFAEGVETSKIMLIGDTPSANEDRAGRPFVGESGELLDKMLRAINLSREENIYLTYLINWYPPGNRLPTEAEISLCMPFIQRHIELAKPEIIICLGDIATKALMETKQSVARLHGEWFEYKTENMDKPTMAIPLFRPEYLINTPIQKAKAWNCLLKIKSKMAELNS